MTELLQKAIAEISKLPDEQQDEIASWLLERLAADQSEAEWEEKVLSEALGDALKPDGSVDFNLLRSQTVVATLDELEGDEE